MKTTIFLGAALLAGCVPTSQLYLSSGRIGCLAGDIVVGDVNSTGHSETWSATCNGQTWFCSSTDEFTEVVCKPQVKGTTPVKASTPAPDPMPGKD